jgi:hypothetical protein
MASTVAFLIGLAVTAGLALAVVWYMKEHLKAILVDLCGTEARAAFWMAFSNVALVLVPVVFAMEFFPNPGADSSVVYHLIVQLKWALTGLIVSVAGLGIILNSFINRTIPKAQEISRG